MKTTCSVENIEPATSGKTPNIPVSGSAGVSPNTFSYRFYKAKAYLRLFVLLLTTLVASSAFAEPSADEIINAAKTKAAAEHKTIFLHFGASWCIWCKRLEAFMDRPDVKPVFEKYFVPVKLDVEEHTNHKDLETPGGADWEQKLGGPAGLPYSAFLDAKGEVIVNSKLNGSNIGYPGEPDEIVFFMSMIKKAAPNISPSDAAVIESALKEFKARLTISAPSL